MLQVEQELAEYTPLRDTIITIGVFDGVHLGHLRLINELLRQSSEYDLLPVALTFQQHPENLFRPSDSRLLLLTNIVTRTQLLYESGVSSVVPLSFTPELAHIDAHTFVSLLINHLKMKSLVIGSDFALGKNREGNIQRLKELGKEMDFSVTVVEPLIIDNETVSSTTIRKALANGDLEKVARFMGRRYCLSGKIISGVGRGISLGYPTANLEYSSEQALPVDGVYAVTAKIGTKFFPAVTNIGKNPTFGNTERTIESFIINFEGDLYGKDITIEFVSRIRDEQKFSSLEELTNQIFKDVETTKSMLFTSGVNI